MIKPIRSQILVKPEEIKEKITKLGIVISSETAKDIISTQKGKVISVGFGKYIDGKLIPVCVLPETMIIFSKYAGQEIDYNDEKYLLLDESDILAVEE